MIRLIHCLNLDRYVLLRCDGFSYERNLSWPGQRSQPRQIAIARPSVKQQFILRQKYDESDFEGQRACSGNAFKSYCVVYPIARARLSGIWAIIDLDVPLRRVTKRLYPDSAVPAEPAFGS